MRIGHNSFLYKYYHSYIGSRIREKAIKKVWPEKDKEVISLPDSRTSTTNILESNRFSPLRKLKELAESSPDKIMFISGNTKHNTSEIFSSVKRLASGLKRLNINPGDKVALMALPYEREMFESFLAIQAIGAVPVLVNFLNPSETIAFMFACSEAKALIVGRDSRLRAGANKLALFGLLENVVTLGKTKYPEAKALGITAKLKSLLNTTRYNPFFYTYDSLVNNSELKDSELFLESDKNNASLQLYTSGTSSRPKRMTYTYEALARIVEITAKRFGITEKDIWLLSVPFYHFAGLIISLGALHFKSPLALADIPRKSDPKTITEAFKGLIKNNVTIFPGVPRIIEPVLEEALKRNSILKDLRLIFSGGAPMTPKLVNLVQKLNEKRAQQQITPIEIINFYASTECGPISSTVKSMTPNTLDNLGLPFDEVEIKLSGDEELLVKVNPFPPEVQSKKLLTPDGFFMTGDQVNIDGDGTLIYKDRITDTLNVNAEKISPLIIQREVEKVPGVKEAHVFGVTKPNEKTDIVCAIVVPKEGYNLKENDIQSYLYKTLDNHLKLFIPRVIFIEPDGIPDSLIRGPGKTPRRVFKEKYGEEAIKRYSLAQYRFVTAT